MLDSPLLSLISNEHLNILSTFYFINTNKSSIHVFRILDQSLITVLSYLYRICTFRSSHCSFFIVHSCNAYIRNF